MEFCEILYLIMQPELHVQPSLYLKDFPNFRRPKIIGYIGLENLKFCQKIENMNVRFDLNLHIDKAKLKNPNQDVKLTDLLKFLLDEEQRLNIPPTQSLDDAHFFCYRGLMTLVACTPYEWREPWKIVVTLYKGNIFLCARDTEEKIRRVHNMTEKERRFTSWGYKFENFVLSDKPNTEPDINLPVDENEEFSLVFTTQLNQHKILYGAEMDGIRCDNEPISQPPLENEGVEAILTYLSNRQYIEVKTNRHIEFPNQENSFRKFKTKKWWCQSFLVGIETILCGFRNDDGIVEVLKVFNVNDLPKMSTRFWNPNVCFNFLDTFFTYVKRCLAREIKRKYGDKAIKKPLHTIPLTSLLLEWKPGQPVRVADNFNYEDDPILPPHFVDKFGKLVNKC